LADLQSQVRRTEHGGAAASDWSDRCVTMYSRIFKAEDKCRGRKACIEVSKFAVTGHPSDGAKTMFSKFSLEGHVSLVS
jgi:hypothetical protein